MIASKPFETLKQINKFVLNAEEILFYLFIVHFLDKNEIKIKNVVF